MNNYDDAIFEYITEGENFSSACDIYEILPEIKERLRNEFWDEVSHILEEKTKDTDWILAKSETEPYLGFWLDTNYKFFVGFEPLNDDVKYGLWIDCDKLDDQNSDVSKKCIKHLQKKISRLDIGLHEDSTYIIRKDMHINFYQNEDLKRILPNKRGAYAKEISKKLIELATSVSDIKALEKIIK